MSTLDAIRSRLDAAISVPWYELDEEFIAQAPTDIAALLAVADAVLEKHKPFEWSFGFGPVKSCKECARLGADETEASYPCPTVAAVTEALGGTE